ncbi:MAG: SDR family oxidoreductase [Hyphomicrobiaceae bacterium]|nr:SDR family oxidoreductase [Hyphomicrobiaceae bacterium]
MIVTPAAPNETLTTEANRRQPARTALITGAGQRIGREIALDLARHGWQVAVHYRNSREAALAVVAEIEANGGRAAAIAGDLSVAEDVDMLIPTCVSKLGAPCCLINNASEFHLDTLETLTRETWHLHLDINLKAPVFLAQSLAANLPTGCEGNIINIIDQRVWNLKPDFFSYTISKAGLWTATRTLAQALAPRVRVNAIGPGPVLRSVHQSDAEFAAECASTLMGHGPSPHEIAVAVRFILDAPAMTGQMIALDAGQHLT